MVRRNAIGLALVAVFAIGARPLAQAQQPVGAADVKPYVWDEGKCQLKFPATPKKDKNILTLSGEGGKTIHTVTMDNNFGVKPGDPGAKLYLDGLRDALVKNLNSKLLTDKDVKGEGFGGREIAVVNDDGGVYRARVLIAGDKIYTVVIVGAKDKATGKDADAFFDSFKLVK